ncbi:acyl-CoA dehydrogenase [Citrobacter portucalensis]|uniref:acyl-CoA dehydrogenase n=1 Tax=Citrobacter portucalensis TaxID=1639133 RepID=UPI0023512155|nr:acyl-CoA dehydrogenase [Citrobacter portucalensis]
MATEYTRTGAVLTLKPGQDSAEFSINAASKDASGVCNMEGTAQQIAAGENQARRWVWKDNASQCVAVLSEQTNGKLTVKTKGCDGYCGLSAAGAMDGTYSRK